MKHRAKASAASGSHKVAEQSFDLFGVWDALLLLAKAEYERSVPNNYFLLQYLGESVDMATSALHSTFTEPKSPHCDLYDAPTFDPRGFTEPWDCRPRHDEGDDADTPVTSAVTN